MRAILSGALVAGLAMVLVSCPNAGLLYDQVERAAQPVQDGAPADGGTTDPGDGGTGDPDDTVAVTGVSLSQSSITLVTGETAQLAAAVEPADATNQAVTWSSADTSVATVDADGLVTAVGSGQTEISVNTEDGGYGATAAVDVTDPVPVSGVSLSRTSIELVTTETAQLVASVEPADATNQDVTWQISDENIATVDPSGLVTARSPGQVSVEVRTVDGGFSSSATIDVSASGIPDSSFGSGGRVSYTGTLNDESEGRALALDASGRIVVVGRVDPASADMADVAVWRYQPDGTLDSSFGGGGLSRHSMGANDFARDVVLAATGRVLVVGDSWNGNDFDAMLWGFSNEGTLDTGFGNDGEVHAGSIDIGIDIEGHSVALDMKGRILLAGKNTDDGAAHLWRYGSDGNPDTSFGSSGVVSEDSSIAYAVAADGLDQPVVAGQFYNGSDGDLAIWRYNENDGTRDTDFHSDGRVTYDSGDEWEWGVALVLDSFGRTVVAGPSGGGIALWRHESDGSLDTSFGSGGKTEPVDGSQSYSGLAFDTKGRMLLTTYFNSQLLLYRFKTDGTLDESFGVDGVVTAGDGSTARGYDVTVDADRRIVVAGYYDGNMALWRFK